MTNESVINNEAQKMLDSFWPSIIEDVKNLRDADLKNQELPLARIKKIMKLDEDVGLMMISGEAPVLFAKAAEMFITELTLRAWIHTEENKRRTLQRNDVAMAISKYDMFDFLIDIVPREELKLNTVSRRHEGQLTTEDEITIETLNSDSTYLQLVQQQNQNETPSSSSTTSSQPVLIQASNVQTAQNARGQNSNSSQLLFSMYPQIQ